MASDVLVLGRPRGKDVDMCRLWHTEPMFPLKLFTIQGRLAGPWDGEVRRFWANRLHGIQ